MTITFYNCFMLLALLFILSVGLLASTTDYLNPRAVYAPVPYQAAANLRTVCYKMRSGARWIEYAHLATGRRFVLNGKQWRDATTGRFVKQSEVLQG